MFFVIFFIILIILLKIINTIEQRSINQQKIEYIYDLYKNQKNKKYKYLNPYNKDLNVFKFIPGKLCKEIGIWDDGNKTYFHKSNIYTCNCGYILDIEKIEILLDI